MTNRELLELAAKAAGYTSFDWVDEFEALIVYDETGRYDILSPLTDDGDALRLAVNLRLLIEPCRTMKGDFVEVHAYPSGRGDCSGIEPLGNDDCAATRRAIVRAAAAIGEGMP